MARKKKAAGEVPLPVPEKPSPPHVEAAVARYREYNATVPPGLSITQGETGLIIDTDTDQKNGIIALMDALGTHDLQFYNGYLTQIINATDTGEDGTKATGVNSALAFIRSIKPRDETEAQLAAQMYATHSAIMTFARRMNKVSTIPQQDSAINAYNKLARTYTAQMEALKRYRNTGEQRVTVTHVSVADGGQAIVGNVTTGPGGGGPEKAETTP